MRRTAEWARRARRWAGRAAALGGVAAASALIPAMAKAEGAPALTYGIANLTYSEVKLGIMAHDVHLLGGVEKGVDINPEVIFASPVTDSWTASLPPYLQWMVQPRPTIGAMLNMSGYTNQYYFGATWTWQLLSNVLRPGDGITFGIFFGPGFNDGYTVTSLPDRKSLGSNVLFREAFELGYRVTPVVDVSVYLDHVSNAGFARYNRSLNELGGRIGIRF